MAWQRVSEGDPPRGARQTPALSRSDLCIGLGGKERTPDTGSSTVSGCTPSSFCRAVSCACWYRLASAKDELSSPWVQDDLSVPVLFKARENTFAVGEERSRTSSTRASPVMSGVRRPAPAAVPRVRSQLVVVAARAEEACAGIPTRHVEAEPVAVEALGLAGVFRPADAHDRPCHLRACPPMRPLHRRRADPPRRAAPSSSRWRRPAAARATAAGRRRPRCRCPRDRRGRSLRSPGDRTRRRSARRKLGHGRTSGRDRRATAAGRRCGRGRPPADRAAGLVGSPSRTSSGRWPAPRTVRVGVSSSSRRPMMSW
jgi:hypothetical protein